MAPDNLILLESLRPWRAAGIDRLFFPHAKDARPFQPTEELLFVWDEPWRALYSKILAPSRTLWTYWELGQDLGPSPDPQRRKVLHNLMRELAWPKGSVAFWPHSELVNQVLAPRMDFFFRGAARIQAEVLVCFGDAGRVLFEDPNTVPRLKALFPKLLFLPDLMASPKPSAGVFLEPLQNVWATL